jgi:hypothetical protein
LTQWVKIHRFPLEKPPTFYKKQKTKEKGETKREGTYNPLSQVILGSTQQQIPSKPRRAGIYTLKIDQNRVEHPASKNHGYISMSQQPQKSPATL